MKQLIVLIFLSFMFLPAFAQQKNTPAQPTDTTKYKVFEFVETIPEYPGGAGPMMEFLNEQTSYVKMAGKPEGLVILQFVVIETGQLTNIKVLRSLHPELDSAAVQAAKAMPNWVPGSQQGKALKVRYTLPVLFSKTVQGKSKSKTKSKK